MLAPNPAPVTPWRCSPQSTALFLHFAPRSLLPIPLAVRPIPFVVSRSTRTSVRPACRRVRSSFSIAGALTFYLRFLRFSSHPPTPPSATATLWNESYIGLKRWFLGSGNILPVAQSDAALSIRYQVQLIYHACRNSPLNLQPAVAWDFAPLFLLADELS
jgi:hypothetical protein